MNFAGKGGAERVVATLAGGFAERGHHCTLFHPRHEGHLDSYDLAETVTHITLPPFAPTGAWMNQARDSLRAAELDVLCVHTSTRDGRIFPALCHGLGVPLVWTEHNNPQLIESTRWNRPERLACMTGADSVVLLCRGFLASLTPSLRNRAAIIPNIALLPAPRRTPQHPGNKRLLTVARLTEPTKHLSVLLRAFALLKDVFPDWECRICGEGPHRNDYEMLITALGINNRITLPGAVEDIAAEYAEADLFTLPSLYEGFGLALAEAQSFGLPAVGFAACSGVNEIIVHGKNGLLAPEITAKSLAEQLRILMADKYLRQRMGARARELSARYDKERILDQWETLFQSVVNRSGPVALDAIDTIDDADIRNKLRELLAEPFSAQSGGSPLVKRAYLMQMRCASHRLRFQANQLKKN